jgi:hypothetical protein
VPDNRALSISLNENLCNLRVRARPAINLVKLLTLFIETTELLRIVLLKTSCLGKELKAACKNHNYDCIKTGVRQL